MSGEGVGLWDLTTRRHIFWLEGCDDIGYRTVYRVVFSHDGQTVATVGRERTLRLWDARTGRLNDTFQGHGADVESVTFSPDDRTIASVDDHGMIQFWDVASGAAGKIASRQGRLWCVEFSPDGRTVVTSSADGSVRLWDSLLDRDRIALRIPSPVVHSMAFSADNNDLLAVGEDGTIWSWDVAGGKPLAPRRFAAGYGTRGSLLSRDGTTLATTDSEWRIRLWQVENGRCTLHPTPEGKESLIKEVAPLGRMFVVSDERRVLTTWDTAAGAPVATVRADLAEVSLSPDGRILASGGWNVYGPCFWDLATDTIRRPGNSGRRNAITALEFFPDGRSLATGGNDGVLKVWDVNTLEVHSNLVGHTGEIKALAIAPRGGTIASGALDSKLKLWRDGSPGAILTIDDHLGPVKQIRFSPDGSTMATCARSSEKDYQVLLWSGPREADAQP